MNTPQAPLRGSIVALVTPMLDDGSVDYPVHRALHRLDRAGYGAELHPGEFDATGEVVPRKRVNKGRAVGAGIRGGRGVPSVLAFCGGILGVAAPAPPFFTLVSPISGAVFFAAVSVSPAPATRAVDRASAWGPIGRFSVSTS